MRRTHHKRGEAIPRAFRGEDKKKSAGGGTPIVIIAALLGAVYYVTRTHPTQHAHAGEIMQLIEAQNRTIAALREIVMARKEPRKLLVQPHMHADGAAAQPHRQPRAQRRRNLALV